MSSKRGIPRFAGVVLVCVGVAVCAVIVVMTLSTMGAMREGAIRAKANGASTQSQATTVAAPANADTTTDGTTENSENTGDVPSNSDNAPSNSDNAGDASANTDNVPANTGDTSHDNEQQVVVESGDTLTSLSREYGRSVDAIANHNGVRDVNLIYADSVLVIPDSCDGN